MVLEAYSKVSPSSLSETDYHYLINNGQVVSVDILGTTLLDTTARLDGYKNPTWQQQIQNGANASTPLTANRFEQEAFTRAEGTGKFFGAIDEAYTFSEHLLMPDFDVSPYAATVQNIALQRARNALNSRFKTFTVLGELRDTIRTLRRGAGLLRGNLDGFTRNTRRHRDFIARRPGIKHRLKRYRDIASDLWLEFSFGVRPLEADIQDAADAYRAILANPTYQRFKFSASEHDINIPREYKGYSFNPYIRWHKYIRRHLKVNAYVAGAVSEKASTGSRLKQRLGLSPREWIPTAWELMPYSWAIDYFTNVGDYLDATVTTAYLNFSYAVTGYQTELKSIFDIEPRAMPGKTVFNLQDGQHILLTRTVSRTPEPTLPLPKLQFTNKLSSSKVLNIGALLNLKLSDRRYRPPRR